MLKNVVYLEASIYFLPTKCQSQKKLNTSSRESANSSDVLLQNELKDLSALTISKTLFFVRSIEVMTAKHFVAWTTLMYFLKHTPASFPLIIEKQPAKENG